ncbi:MAG: vitamin K epoxide reductase family protein [Acidobacteria bacterium]|nr:vitamin K epoxide reductase family protein [Acidobacteriota bacterium]
MTIDGSINSGGVRKAFPLVAILFAIVGVIDAIYLTYHHYTAEEVPCGLTGGCEMVLTSPYATFHDIPIAIFGAAAYLAALLFALLAVTGRRWAWWLYGLQTLTMASFSVWLIYVQANYIQAYCQFCLLSAGTSFTLFLIFLISLAFKHR